MRTQCAVPLSQMTTQAPSSPGAILDGAVPGGCSCRRDCRSGGSADFIVLPDGERAK